MKQIDLWKRNKIQKIKDMTIKDVIRELEIKYESCSYCAYDYRKNEENKAKCEEKGCDEGIKAYLESEA